MNEEEPLGLAKGSVRAIIALALVATLCITSVLADAVPKGLLGIAAIAIGYYFGTRTAAAN